MPELFAALNTLLFGVVIALLSVALTVLLAGRNRRHRGPMQIKLKELAVIWAKDGRGQVHISELAPLWRDEETLAAAPDYNALTFGDPRIREFAEQQVKQATWFRRAPEQAGVVLQILSLLDREGGCPSVVNISGDVEATWDSSTFGTLARITLRDHTLNVAEEAIKALKQADAAHIIPDALIAALGHDLGKLESSREYLYSLGEHPLAAGKALAAIPEFRNLPKKEEILRAIKRHHKSPEGLLGKTLKAADQHARQMELEEVVAAREAAREAGEKTAPIETATSQAEPPASPAEILPPAAPAPAPLPPSNQDSSAATPSPPSSTSNPDNSAAAWRAEAAIYGGDEAPGGKKSPVTGPIKMVDISSWFDVDDFIAALKPYINKLHGRRWMAFSMSDGHVYIQAKALEEVARKQAERAGAMGIATMAADDETMRQVLFTIVSRLRVEHQDIIARGLIRDQYFGGYFEIATRTGKRFKGFYTPFHAEAFGSIAEMEADKKGLLKDFLSVEPAGKES
ncbi:HD domain-containing protein [Desulfurivibrio sp. D14AmB]|uniref:HD domain-containing protein n=1 Tax=Desulfurivibrio sp. D14AmB TaxID=3374370 RepID=UPI00376F1CE7